jgi:hypothetical protein
MVSEKRFPSLLQVRLELARGLRRPEDGFRDGILIRWASNLARLVVEAPWFRFLRCGGFLKRQRLQIPDTKTPETCIRGTRARTI